MGIFKRLFKIGESEANAAIDKLEDPINMTDQGIRDLEADLDKSIRALAEVKALCIRSKNDLDNAKNSVAEYENKAMLLLKRAESGAMQQSEADRLATLALQKKSEALQNIPVLQSNFEKNSISVSKLESNIKMLKANLDKWRNEARMLKARAKVSEATSNVNKQLAGIDSSSTVGMLERMKEKVDQQEALAESYADIALTNRSAEDEINSALAGTGDLAVQSDLAALKAKMSGTAIGQGSAQGNVADTQMSDLDMLKAQMNQSAQPGTQQAPTD